MPTLPLLMTLKTSPSTPVALEERPKYPLPLLPTDSSVKSGDWSPMPTLALKYALSVVVEPPATVKPVAWVAPPMVLDAVITNPELVDTDVPLIGVKGNVPPPPPVELIVTAPVAPEIVTFVPATIEVTPVLVTFPAEYAKPDEKVVVATNVFCPFKKASIVPGVGVPKKVDVATKVGAALAPVPFAKTVLAVTFEKFVPLSPDTERVPDTPPISLPIVPV